MTSVLTDEEIDAVAEAHPYNISLYTRAIEAAVIKRLAAGVSVEPVAERRRIRYSWGECWDYRDDEKVPFTVPFNLVVVTPTTPLFTLEQLTTERAAARVQENERCLALMDSIGCDWRDAGDMAKFYAANYLREAIRALLGKEQS